MYKNLLKDKKNLAPIQVNEKGQINKRRKGRPPRKNMKTYSIRMDEGLHSKTFQRSTELGVSTSFVIAEALRKYFKGEE